jgi:hypothetical protein
MELLESCHGRMRDFTALAYRLSSAASSTPREEIADVARSIQHYFESSFPAHSLDEEQSLIPRLRALDPAIGEALARIEPEHRELDTVVGTVCRLCATLAPGLAGSARTVACDKTSALPG